MNVAFFIYGKKYKVNTVDNMLYNVLTIINIDMDNNSLHFIDKFGKDTLLSGDNIKEAREV